MNTDPRILIASIRTVSPDDEKYTYSTIPRHTNGRLNHSYLLDNRFALGADFVAQYSAIIHICMAEVPDSPLNIRFTYCLIKQRTLVISYEIWLREGLLHQQMQQRGTFVQEYDWLVLFSKVHSLMTPTVCLPRGLVVAAASVTPGTLKIPYWKMARYPLYPHQIESLLWMEQLEARVLSGEASYSVTSSDTVRLGSSKYIFRRGSPARFEHVSGGSASSASSATPGSIFYHGGLLADATGTGKTAITLALILRQQQNKRGGAAAAPAIAYPKNAWFVARGTLIITPVNLARQWSCEIQKFLQPQHPLKVIEILDQRHAKSLSLDELEAADIVITTRAHLKHIEYIRKCNQQWAAVCDSIPDHYKNASSWPPLSIIDMGTRAAFHQNQRWRGYVPLNSLYWRRIIVDEAHEEHPSSNFLCGLRALVWFGLTGTPEPLTSDLYTQLLLVGGGGAGASSNGNLNLHPTQPFLDLCIQRHKNITFPGQFSTQQHVHRIQLEPTHDAEYRQLQDDVTEAESEEALIKCGVLWHGPQVNPSTVPLMPRDKILKTMNAMYDAQAHTLQRSQHQFRDNPQEVARLAELRDKLTRQHEYFATSALSPNLSVCPICYDQTAFCLLLCGHWFCETCLGECHVCAMCKEPTTKNMYQVDTEHTRREYFQRMGKQYGEKFRVILETLYEIVLQKREKAVVFIQFTKILSQFHRILELTIPGIRVAKLIGNTSSRAAVIDCFVNQQTVDVLFLPMELSNSGLNLTMANHVLYVHPMLNAAPAISLRTHEQCLGRVIRPTQTRNVTVHYFIIQNSIEEEALKNLLGSSSASVSATATITHER